MMDCQEWTLSPGAGSEGFYKHEGEEFIRVLEGSFEVEVDGLGVATLNEGDSIYFESNRAHSWRSVGSTRCRLIWVNTPPTF
jgi:quercetin dioxygenase-like cupin family protein